MKMPLTTWADRLLIMILVIALPFSYRYFWQSNGEQPIFAEISLKGNVIQKIALNKPGKYTVSGPIGKSIIEIKNRSARFIRSPCHGKQCIHMGWQSHTGSFAACLPNRLTLTIKGGTPKWDSINF